MKNLLLTLTIALVITSCEDGTVGKYEKEPLPDKFSYSVLEDNSDEALEKNQLTLEINQKLTEGQIATLADELFRSKQEQRRFYIFYLLPGMKIGSGAWATSHFDPELNIQILGSTSIEDEKANALTNQKIDGQIIGKWREEQYTSSKYIIYKKDNRNFIRIIYKGGQIVDEELIEKKMKNRTRYDYKEKGYNEEYFVVNAVGDLEFYNSENKKFTTATKAIKM